MKRKIIFLIVLTLIFTSVMGFTATNSTTLKAASFFQKVDFTDGVVAVADLNVRQGPDQKYAIINDLKKGSKVKVLGLLGEWYAIYDVTTGRVGSAYSKYIKVDESMNVSAKAPVNTPTKAPAKASASTKALTKAPTKTPTNTPTKAPTKAPTKSTTKAPSKASAVAPKTVLPTKHTSVAKSVNSTPLTGISQDEQTLLNLVNKARTNAGDGPLSFDMDLVKTARLKAKDMAGNNYFSHQSPTYGSPFDMMKEYNISFKAAGENIAGNSTVSGAFTAWMNSDGHKKNILNAGFGYIGIGIVDSSTYGKILVQQFIGK